MEPEAPELCHCCVGIALHGELKPAVVQAEVAAELVAHGMEGSSWRSEAEGTRDRRMGLATGWRFAGGSVVDLDSLYFFMKSFHLLSPEG